MNFSRINTLSGSEQKWNWSYESTLQLKLGARAPLPSEWLTHDRERFQNFKPFFTSLVSLTSEDGWTVLITFLTAPPPPPFPSSTLHCSLLFCLEGSLVSIRIPISGQRDLYFPWESGSLSITTSKGKLSMNRQLCRHKRSNRMK